MKLIYLVSTHNSGSTIIALVANTHPDIVSPGEVCGPGNRFRNDKGPVCSCGAHVADCFFWQEVSKRYKKEGYPWQPDNWGLIYTFEGNPFLSKLVFSKPGPQGKRFSALQNIPILGDKIKKIQARNREYIKSIHRVSKREVILDASKHPERLIFLMQIPDLDLRVVHLIRDPRGWCNSRRKNYSADIETAARSWVKQNTFMEEILTPLPAEKKMNLRYEDFCLNPQDAMGRICNLGGLPPVDVPQTLEGVTHHVLGNRMRTDKEIKIKQDTSWQSELAADEIDTINSITNDFATKCGYNLAE